MSPPYVFPLQLMALTGILMASMAAHAGCRLQTVAPHASEARAGALSFTLGKADEAIAPKAWQGPLVARACTLDIGIIERPLMLTSGNLLYVPTYSGSMRKLMLVDLARCAIPWQSGAFSGNLTFGPQQLQLGAMRIALDARCAMLAHQQTIIKRPGYFASAFFTVTGTNVRSAKS
ncbi:MAG: hypothetical protein H7335_06405 [Massilia sp.]|nr:hypothetical protein [Massilia sp.]